MNKTQALSEASQRFGDVQLSVTVAGDCVISIRDEGHYVPMGYGRNWEDALIDCACQFTFAVEGTYA